MIWHLIGYSNVLIADGMSKRPCLVDIATCRGRMLGSILIVLIGAQRKKKENNIRKNMSKKLYTKKELDEAAYQCAYDLSDDWLKETPTWEDVEKAFKEGYKDAAGKNY